MREALGEPHLLGRTAELFTWKHFDNPFGPSISLVAETNDRIVGLRTFMRWELQTPEGDRISCVRAVDTATHPKYHRRGVFRRLTEEAIEVATAKGVDMVFNTPNARSGPGYEKMGWQRVGTIGGMVRPSLRLFSRRTGNVPELEPTSFLGSPTPCQAFSVHDRPALGLRTPRTDDYLKWRFCSHPTARYFVVGAQEGFALVRPNVRGSRRELVIADLFGRPKTAVRRAVDATRAHYLATWFSKGSPERAAAIRQGLLPVPRFTALTLMMRPLRDLPGGVTSMGYWDTAVSDFELL